jgi:predicted CxxxxCH...CXXCH cytochrome family protein
VNWNDPGHLTTPDGQPKTKAVVTFTAQSLAAQGTTGRSGPPAYDGASCSNIYCHGVTLQDPKATHTTPKWTGGSAEATCGTCHGAPPGSHDSKYASNNQCTNCHQLSVAGNGAMIPSGHVNGVLEVGDNSGTCAACHGSAANGNAASAPTRRTCATCTTSRRRSRVTPATSFQPR